MELHTPGVHHLALRVTDFERSKNFYLEKLGFKAIMEKPGLCLFIAGTTPIAIIGPGDSTNKSDHFDPFKVGLDHIAFACENKSDLEKTAAELNKEGIKNTGIKHDALLDKDYIAFKDPDNISWEYYMV
jgi:glyoxylase I family protein